MVAILEYFVFEWCRFCLLEQTGHHVRGNDLISQGEYKQNGYLDLFDSADRRPMVFEHESLEKPQFGEYMVNHTRNRCESVLDYQPRNRIFELAAGVDRHSPSQTPSMHIYSSSVNVGSRKNMFQNRLCIKHQSLLGGLSLAVRVASVGNKYHIDLNSFLVVVEVVDSGPNV